MLSGLLKLVIVFYQKICRGVGNNIICPTCYFLKKECVILEWMDYTLLCHLITFPVFCYDQPKQTSRNCPTKSNISIRMMWVDSSKTQWPMWRYKLLAKVVIYMNAWFFGHHAIHPPVQSLASAGAADVRCMLSKTPSSPTHTMNDTFSGLSLAMNLWTFHLEQ